MQAMRSTIHTQKGVENVALRARRSLEFIITHTPYRT
jgi:hypothetical protein